MLFVEKDKVRTKPKPIYKPKTQLQPATIHVAAPRPPLLLSLSTGKAPGSMKPPKRPAPLESRESLDGQPPRKIIKLKINTSKVEEIQRLAPNPGNLGAKSFSSHSSPGPRPSPAVTASPGPSPSHAPAPVMATLPSSLVPIPAKARKPLPDSAPNPPQPVRKQSIIKLKFTPKPRPES